MNACEIVSSRTLVTTPQHTQLNLHTFKTFHQYPYTSPGTNSGWGKCLSVTTDNEYISVDISSKCRGRFHVALSSRLLVCQVVWGPQCDTRSPNSESLQDIRIQQYPTDTATRASPLALKNVWPESSTSSEFILSVAYFFLRTNKQNRKQSLPNKEEMIR